MSTKLKSRMIGASGILGTLIHVKALVRGMNARVARSVYNSFVEAKWTFGCCLVPFSLKRQKGSRMVDAMDACLVSVVLTSCRVQGRTLGIARALLRIDNPTMVRTIKTHQIISGLLAATKSKGAPEVVSLRTALAL